MIFSAEKNRNCLVSFITFVWKIEKINKLPAEVSSSIIITKIIDVSKGAIE